MAYTQGCGLYIRVFAPFVDNHLKEYVEALGGSVLFLFHFGTAPLRTVIPALICRRKIYLRLNESHYKKLFFLSPQDFKKMHLAA